MIFFINSFFVFCYLNILTITIMNNSKIIDIYIKNTYIEKIYNIIPLYENIFNIFLIVIFVIASSIHYSLFKRNSPRYRVYIADKIIKKLKRENLNQIETILFLRKIDPFVFEEILLSSFKKIGYKIKRNKRYTGDGGSDGKVWIKNKMYHIQAKRYKSYIKNKDMVDFIYLIRREKSKGMFIHTGVMGKKTKELAEKNKVKVLSDNLLYDLIIKQIYMEN